MHALGSEVVWTACAIAAPALLTDRLAVAVFLPVSFLCSLAISFALFAAVERPLSLAPRPRPAVVRVPSG